ncbi:glycosyltransferase [Corynebacterium qintianiae]|uniref:Glycosyltransferase n=1 Tax=Corynebacterium qintianiae TaxID=2709392 RepID=A0A7T0KN17_9CORY|nr:glycosyltransferase [Corynebacterium qintianiae]QPK83489.1 glycosyltransferase [Corynebacterium qintianiae]
MWIDYAARQALSSVGAFVRAPRLKFAANASSLSFPQEGDTVVSLTTHGDRMSASVASIASLLMGTELLPVFLWLDRVDFESEWPEGLRGLVDRGLQVRCSDGAFGPHTKYFGTFAQFAGTDTRVITVDDDMMYPRWFAQKLLNASDADPGLIVAYRAHEITFRGDQLDLYRRWKAVYTTAPSHRHFATGVSGVAYPPSMVEYVARQGTGFIGHAPKADDVWLNACALRSNHMVRQVFPHPREFSIVPGSQRTALVRGNLGGGGNDVQIAATYTHEDVARLLRAD